MSKIQPVNDALEILTRVPYFFDLDRATLETIARAAVRREFDTGQVVFLEGDECVGLYVVQHGWLKAIKTSREGREQVLRVVGPGDFFNDLGIFVGARNLATVIALEPAAVWIVERQTMLQLLDDQPRVARIVIQYLGKRVMHLLTLVEDLSLRSVEARLARLLLEQSPGDVIQRRRWTTQAEIAARLGTVPDVLNRALRGLVEEGLIEVERHEIRIRDREGLANKAGARS